MANRQSTLIPPVATALLCSITQTMLGAAKRDETVKLTLPSLKQRALSVVARKVPMLYTETSE